MMKTIPVTASVYSAQWCLVQTTASSALLVWFWVLLQQPLNVLQF
jgi:hypothetical protein